jgi:hypothetical protein
MTDMTEELRHHHHAVFDDTLALLLERHGNHAGHVLGTLCELMAFVIVAAGKTKDFSASQNETVVKNCHNDILRMVREANDEGTPT